MYQEDCGICFEKDNEWKYLECKHRICNLCYNKLNKRECPFCRKEIKEILNEYTETETMENNSSEGTIDSIEDNIDINIGNDCIFINFIITLFTCCITMIVIIYIIII